MVYLCLHHYWLVSGSSWYIVSLCKTPVNIWWYRHKVVLYRSVPREYHTLLNFRTSLNHPTTLKCIWLNFSHFSYHYWCIRSHHTLKRSSCSIEITPPTPLPPSKNISLTIDLNSSKVSVAIKRYWYGC